ncbi:MAG TPA: type II toxin-antitoxin system VapC family toxin [Tepidisphaeraceae bacterium]|nr:type II toxin-antitoxin system VapC family toxin [Tepidisphaeraceae bacterium]
MNLLLDSNVFVFVVQQPERLSPSARAAIVDPANTRYLSLVTPWELQIKSSLRKFDLGKPIRDIVLREMDTGTVQLLPITLDHIDALSRLPDHHRDPFDRLLIAQAIHENLTIVTGDETIARYPVPTLWK